jgi:hypothetical protein
MTMTEDQWLSSADPDTMLTFLQGSRRASDRKFRLVACACCRRIEHLLADGRSRRAVAVAEREAEGLAGPGERVHAAREAALAFAELGAAADVAAPDLASALDWFHDRADTVFTRDAYQAAVLVARVAGSTDPGAARAVACAAFAAHAAVSMEPSFAAVFAAGQAALAVAFTRRGTEPEAGDPEECAAQTALLREIIGNPFRPPACWPFPAGVVGLARSIAEGQHGLYPVLADALDDLGQAAAAHCRQAPHACGCHLVDWILDKV